MKKFLFRVLLPSIVIIMFVLGCCELYLRSLPNDFKDKAEFMEKYASEIKVWVLGSSSTAMGVKPACFEMQPSYNCAYANQPIEYSYMIFTNYIENMSSLRWVVIDANYPCLWGSDEYAKTFIKRYAIYYGLEGFKGFQNNFEISANIKDIYKRITHESDRAAFTTCDSDGFQSRYYKNIPYDDEKWKEYGKTHCVEDHTRIYTEDESKVRKKNTEFLKEMISVCRDHGIMVLFLSMPCHPYYYKYYDMAQKSVVDSTFSAFCEEFDNVKWLDYTTSEDFDNDDRFNVNHLNVKGAVKFTKMINDSIMIWNSYLKD